LHKKNVSSTHNEDLSPISQAGHYKNENTGRNLAPFENNKKSSRMSEYKKIQLDGKSTQERHVEQSNYHSAYRNEKDEIKFYEGTLQCSTPTFEDVNTRIRNISNQSKKCSPIMRKFTAQDQLSNCSDNLSQQ
jgi:hypothetical protein